MWWRGRPARRWWTAWGRAARPLPRTASALPRLGAIPLCYRSGIVVVVLIVALSGALRGVSDISKRVLLPVVVHEAGMDLARATALYDAISRLSTLVGAPVAGAMIAWLDAPRVIAVDAASFAACAALVRHPRHAASLAPRAGREPVDLPTPPARPPEHPP
jgi:hypothetical protein